MKIKCVAILGFVLLLSACSPAPVFTANEAAVKYPSIRKLYTRIERAQGAWVDLLAQEGFTEANESLQKAIALGEVDDPQARTYANSGLEQITQAEILAARVRPIFEDVIQARNRALKSGTPEYLIPEMSKVDEQFFEATWDFENGREVAAKEQRLYLVKKYNELSVDALKQSAIEQASLFIEKAEDAGARKYASKTFDIAEKELNLAVEVIDADPLRGKQKADHHAERAVWWAQRSMVITALANEFDENNYNSEDIILWYQSQLEKVMEPFGAGIAANVSNAEMIGDIQQRISRLKHEKQVLRTDLSNTHSNAQRINVEINQKIQKLEINNKKIDQVQALFTPAEAEVFQKNNAILIRAYGLTFNQGQGEVTAKNYSLLNKVVQAIKLYPNAEVNVIGHTDSTGEEKINVIVSKQRALNVSRFITQAAGLKGYQMRFDGVGSSQPVRSEHSTLGQSANRRVDIIIGTDNEYN